MEYKIQKNFAFISPAMLTQMTEDYILIFNQYNNYGAIQCYFNYKLHFLYFRLFQTPKK